MAANYWASTQCRNWQFTRGSLAAARQSLEDKEAHLIQQYPLPDRRLLSQFFNQQLAKLGKRMSVRQQALATAQVYLRRFYNKVEIRRTNPYLIIATALYLACKMEECPQHIRVVISESRQLWPNHSVITDVSKLGECEFWLISEINSQMIVHHPYRTLNELQPILELSQDDSSSAWSVINDHYLTDLPLLFPPHIIAVTAILFAMTMKPTPIGFQAAANAANALAHSAPEEKNARLAASPAETDQQWKIQQFMTWLAQGDLDLKAIIDCTQEIISLYDILEHYSEATCKDQIARCVRARGLEK
ncbi:uncharacterized protein KY384_007683 [Bacidia gigantensis]|uniref:uncharacterized protein n=1 Tax=Bacidia gigantensis TaxID=2732470 RepID=UPI001D058EF1|nr:uncharacterized protein KY384_007683 [Bacidia gigantensis]KAG8527531.1 hypothetical protein KY384_007683 [Bacidia gigantensis]